jgi:hypothetical protein
VSRLAVLLAFVYYFFQNKIEEGLLLCNSLESRETGGKKKKKNFVINSHLTEHQISWEQCVDVCAAANRAKTGKMAGVVAHIKEFAPSRSSGHCVLH